MLAQCEAGGGVLHRCVRRRCVAASCAASWPFGGGRRQGLWLRECAAAPLACPRGRRRRCFHLIILARALQLRAGARLAHPTHVLRARLLAVAAGQRRTQSRNEERDCLTTQHCRQARPAAERSAAAGPPFGSAGNPCSAVARHTQGGAWQVRGSVASSVACMLARCCDSADPPPALPLPTKVPPRTSNHCARRRCLGWRGEGKANPRQF
jgi:hypothetical protein